MTVYIDSNTFAANPALYADAEKKKPLPRVLPAVQLREGKLNVAFLGDRAPTTDMVLSLSAVLAGTQTQILAEYGDPVDGADVPTWEFPFALNSQALADVLANKQRSTLLVGVIATAEGYRREWQIVVMCDPTATGELDPEQVESVKTFADAAKRSADNAAESESNAAQSATDSAESATASSQSASASATSASNSATSASNAKTSEDNAKTSETNAAQSASDAAKSATDAQSSASSAATSATNAANSASSANTSAGNASNSASSAATSANNAAQSASLAKTSETNAKASETAAKASETASATSATNAATSATNAKTSETNAATSATSAGNSATNAATSADEAESTLDTFRDEKATLEANIDWLKIATDGDWRNYMMARAAQTGKNTYINLVKRVITEYAADPTTSVLGGRMFEDWGLLFHSDAWTIAQGGESPWTPAFWEAYFEECIRWEKNPEETLNWSAASGNNPYKDVAPTKPVVNFSVTRVEGSGSLNNSFSRGFGVPFYFPNCTSYPFCFRYNTVITNVIIRSKKTANLSSGFRNMSALETVDIEVPATSSAMYVLYSSTKIRRVRLNVQNGKSWGGGMLDYANGNIESITLNSQSQTSIGSIATTGGGGKLTTFVFIGGLPVCQTWSRMISAPVLTHFSFNEDDTETVEALDFPAMLTLTNTFSGYSVLNQPMSFPALSSGVDAFLNAGMDSANISYVLNSLPAWDDGESHVITFTGCPGQVATQRFEPFTVTDDDGVEYTIENCPTFDGDDEEQTLRKAFVLAQEKKGWTIEISEPIAQWYNYMLEKAALTGDAATTNTATVERAKTELDTSGMSALAMRLYEDWVNLSADYEAWLASIGEESPLDAAFWTEYFGALAEWEANPTATIEWTVTNNGGTYTSNCPHFSSAPTAPVVNFSVVKATGATDAKALFNEDTNVPIYLPNATDAKYALYKAPAFNSAILLPKAIDCTRLLFGIENVSVYNQPTYLPSATEGRALICYQYKYNKPFFMPKLSNAHSLVYYAATYNQPATLPSATELQSAFSGSGLNSVVALPSAISGRYAFVDTEMSAEAISGTLDTLPAYTSGTHTISFTGCPGAAELTQDSPSVAAAVAKGWTVEL